jgi:hypothetical protein
MHFAEDAFVGTVVNYNRLFALHYQVLESTEERG